MKNEFAGNTEIKNQTDNSNNKGIINKADGNAKITANQTIIYNTPKVFNPHKKIMHDNLQMLSPHFTGREEYISKIESLLKKQGIITICGNGGIGKTQIVLKYIEKNNIGEYFACNFGSLVTDYYVKHEKAMPFTEEIEKNGIKEGYYIISVGALYDRTDIFSWLRNYEPYEKIGHSIFVYKF